MTIDLDPNHLPLLLEVARNVKARERNQGSEKANMLREIIFRLECAQREGVVNA